MKIQNRSGKKEFEILARNGKYAVVDEGEKVTWRYTFGIIWKNKKDTEWFEVRTMRTYFEDWETAEEWLKNEIDEITRRGSAKFEIGG